MSRLLPKMIPALGKLSLLVLIVALPVLFPPIASAAETPKKVLIFSGTDPNLPTVVSMSEILRSTLEKGSPTRVQFYSEALDNHRIPEDKYEQELIKLLQRKYEGEKFDLIYTLSSPALKFLLKHQDELFPDTPKIFFHTNEREGDGLDLGQNITGVQGRIELRPALDLALSLHPGTRRVVVITGNSRMERLWEALAHKEFQSFGNSVEFTYLTNTTIEELRKELASLPPKTIVFFMGFMLDREGNGYSLPESVSLVAPSSSAPVYVTLQSGFRPGVVGGHMISYEALGKTAADLGLRILRGERPQDIPPQTVPSVAMFDWRELRRWGISEQKLPPGSIVRFKEPTVWEEYKWRIIGVIALVILEALLIFWLLLNRARRRRAEGSLRESEERLTQAISVARFGVFEHDHLGETLHCSPLSREIHGWGEESQSLKVIFSQLHPEDRDAFVAAVQQAHDPEGNGFFAHEFRIMLAGGEVRWISCRAQTFFQGENGRRRPARTIGAELDITERKRAEESLRGAVEEVNQLKNQLQAENIYLQEEIKLEHNFEEIVGHSDAIKYVLYKIEQVAPTDTTVFITGETGTGKELVARAIHGASPRRDRPLVKVNCAALSASLIESELFGHEKGAFTGAAARKIGRFELANGATIFLDEIGELPLELQVKLLRVIQEGEFERLGSSKTLKVDARIISATNRNLQAEVEKGRFREDLWFRLNVFPITVPPLRQRGDDIQMIIEHFVRRLSKKVGKEITSISPTTLKTLCGYSWPGNIRELSNVIERAVINTHGAVLHMTDHFDAPKIAEASESRHTLEEIEREYIVRVLGDTGGKIEGPNGAARILGLNPSTLRTRMNKLGIQKHNQSFV